MAHSAATGTASSPINDTGMTQCVDLTSKAWTASCQGTGQDGEFGRDATKLKHSDGRAGFAYIKVCNSGELAGEGACPSKPKFGTGLNKWGCTKDKVTGLIWEIKTTDGGLRDAIHVFTNYRDQREGDSSNYLAQVNLQGLCGANDWRLPTAHELGGLMDLSVPEPGPKINLDWFPTQPQHGLLRRWPLQCQKTLGTLIFTRGSRGIWR